ncbi:aminotransferase class I/II-fold pyridoxal phosphate-dependent enzyme [Chitinophaga japonensis]|uniref:7-keto-8-aminopelargonate synthetase-like enzyme n=1 Tax=Chitinophaga japonensis TaxID=104662 RepID=A0A562T5N9_CHIJA|nr:aminotransferase class I/II-fold pyridoxal phosphate-dependent enzyme [Chitinophaga japonensis]TWI88859.1 7-keto-8-aminopelargonate synthetase-like enzyme [Chitinophaga japonensis]
MTQPLQTATTPGRTVTVAGRTCLFFSGFSYLGMHAQPAFREALQAGTEQFGPVFLSSRVANVRLSIYEELEHALAVLFRQQAAAAYSSGYLAAQAAVHYAAQHAELLYAPGAHPALRLNGADVPGQDWETWAQQTVTRINSQPDHTFALAADAVNPLTSTINDFSWLAAVERKMLAVIDDSHGAGILGTDGEGIVHALPVHTPVRYLLTASLAKAYSIPGGLVAGHAADIAAMKRQPAFTASSPIMPAGAYAFLQSQSLYAARRNKLRLNIQYFRQQVTGNPLVHNPHHLPVFLLQPGQRQPAIDKYLLDHDIIISSFAYPDPSSPPIHRIVLSALHEPFDMDALAKMLGHFNE